MQEGFKVCSKCKVEKPVGEFYKREGNIGGYRYDCKECVIIAVAIWHNKNRIKTREYVRRYESKNLKACEERHKRWELRNPGKRSEYAKRWRKKHPEKSDAANKLWKKNNPDKVREKNKRYSDKKRSTTKGALEHRMSELVRNSLRKSKGGRRWKDLVGYTTDELKNHLESLFTEGMTWDLFVQGKIHIDHVFPLSRLYFTGTDDPTFKFAWSLENLQPLWAKDNLIKHNKISVEQKGRG